VKLPNGQHVHANLSRCCFRGLWSRVCDSPERREELQKYIPGIVTRKGQKLIAIYCMPDHTHILVGLKPSIAPSDLIGDIKTGSTNHINEQKWIGCRFSWQEGFGAFSFSHSHLGRVADYIRNQEVHHRRKSFQQEYIEFLERHRLPLRSALHFQASRINSGILKHAAPTELLATVAGGTINIALLTGLFTLRMTN